MDHRYLRFDPSSRDTEQLFSELERVFQQLVLMVGGDVEQALEWMEGLGKRHGWFDHGLSLEEFRRRLLDDGQIEEARGGELRLSSKGEIRIRRDSLARVFAGLTRTGTAGDHRTARAGAGLRERLPETRPFQAGDEVADLDWSASTKNVVRRTGDASLAFREDDLEVHETEATTSCATVIAIDISHSMTLYGEDRITPAKQVALALVELIRTRFPRDDISVLTFGDRAQLVEVPRILYLQNGPYHTNTREGLELAAQVLSRKKQPNKQVFLITDGKPSCLTERGRLYKNPFGLDERVVNKTLEMAAVLRAKNIVVTTFMLTDDPVLVGFVEDFTKLNKGRAYYSRADELGSFLFVDYLRNRRRRVH